MGAIARCAAVDYFDVEAMLLKPQGGRNADNTRADYEDAGTVG